MKAANRSGRINTLEYKEATQNEPDSIIHEQRTRTRIEIPVPFFLFPILSTSPCNALFELILSII
jgi:hypothetical protein